MGVLCSTNQQNQPYPNHYNQKKLTIANSSTEQNILSSNKKIGSVLIGPFANITVIYGHFSQHSGNVLFCFSTQTSANYCPELREYATDAKRVVHSIQVERKVLNDVKVDKRCPYHKLIVCIIPEYNFKEDAEDEKYEYLKHVRVMTRNLFQQHNDLTLHLTQAGERDSIIIPNQTIVSLLIKQLLTCLQRNTYINMISSQPRVLQMVRYELLKTQAYSPTINQWDLKGLPEMWVADN